MRTRQLKPESELKNKYYAKNRDEINKRRRGKDRTDAKRAYQRKWEEQNRERIKAARKIYYLANRERIWANPTTKARAKAWRKSPKALEYRRRWNKSPTGQASRRRYERKNREKRRATKRRTYLKKQATAEGVLINRLKAGLGQALRRSGVSKSTRTLSFIGCTAAFLRTWIESQFPRGMTWKNRAKWDLDHIRPVASFDHSDPKQVSKCWHYTNLRPMWKAANIQKGRTIIPFPAVNLDLFAQEA